MHKNVTLKKSCTGNNINCLSPSFGASTFSMMKIHRRRLSPEILDISSPLTKSAVFYIPKKIKHGGREDSNGKEVDFVRNFTQFKLC